MAVSTPRNFAKNSARSTPSSCDGRLANTNGSRVTSWRLGIGCGRCIKRRNPNLFAHWALGPTSADDGSRVESRGSRPVLAVAPGLRRPAPLAYLHAYATVAEAKAGIGSWLDFYNTERQHQSLGYRTPRQIYQEGLWICGRSALPTGCASPASRASSEGGEMLTFWCFSMIRCHAQIQPNAKLG